MGEACRAVAPEAAVAAADAVGRRLLALPEVAGAARVALYAALADELPTRGLFERVRGAGSSVLLPRCGGDRRLEFAAVERWEDLRAGRYGVSEPPGAAEPLVPGDVVVVPGRAFDGRGFRLGRGSGWYDRTFPVGVEAPFLVGVGFAFQRVRAVPAGPHDRAMDAVVTDREATRVTPAGGGEQP